jgi:hypothetical protein
LQPDPLYVTGRVVLLLLWGLGKTKTTISIKSEKNCVSMSKMWTCKDAPLGGMVHLEGKVDGKTNIMEMTDSSRGSESLHKREDRRLVPPAFVDR